MKVEKAPSAFFPFKDHYKKTAEEKKEQQKKKKDVVDKSKETKEDNVIGWA